MKNYAKGVLALMVAACLAGSVQAQSKMDMKKDTTKMAKKKMDKMVMKKDKMAKPMKMKKDTSKMSKM